MILNTAIYLDPLDQSWDTVDRMQMAYTTTGTLRQNIYQLYVNGVWENSVKEEIQFDSNDNYETQYPRFTNLVKNLKTFVKDNPDVLNALQRYSGFSKQKIIDHLS